MVRVYVGIGSNIDPDRQVRLALGTLRAQFGPLVISPVYRSKALGFTGDDFYNLVVGLDTSMAPMELADTLRRIEADHGRVRTRDKAIARTLDLDVLTYGDQILHEGRLVLPRSDITRYAFVLRPLADIAPDERHPALGVRYSDLWAGFDATAHPLERIRLDPEDADGQQA
ncbi:MAG: 2-amino-4-hydroxy-6-hydroxymethyldihydropteridine diphosphokinase [Aquisalimonadaceae bacterium]